MRYCLGKNPPANDPRDLLLSKYLSTPLPTPPPSQDYSVAVTKDNGTFPMYGNDRWGDCTCAAAGHMVQVWTANAGPLVTLPLKDILDAYKKLSPNDTGCTLNQVLNFWRKTGFGGHKIDGYAKVSLNNQTEIETALQIFGTVYLGLELPAAVCQDANNMLTVPWEIPAGQQLTGKWAPDPNNGHCVNVVGYASTEATIVTWGEKKQMSWGFFNAYVDEAFAVLSGDWISASGSSPAGFNLAALEADLKVI